MKILYKYNIFKYKGSKICILQKQKRAYFSPSNDKLM